MEDAKGREAKFQSVIAYLDETLREPKVFKGDAEGKITKAERKTTGKAAFGFDPIFQPIKSQKTFAEMTIEEKNGYSHRAMAVRKFAEWYKQSLLAKK
jgi:XTP/dITP diphosphohydrolase